MSKTSLNIDDIENDIKEYFGSGFEEKRWIDYQKPLLCKMLKDNSRVLGLLPTGIGKSILYQYFSLFHSDLGIIIVIEPLQSIIQDQINSFNESSDNLSLEIHAGTFTKEILNCSPKDFPKDIKILYIDPERLFRYSNNIYNLINNGIKIQMVVIDEIHTMFEWGSSFRSEFLFIPSFIKKIEKLIDNFKVLALSATLNQAEIDLSMRYLGIEQEGFFGKPPKLSDDKKNITDFFYSNGGKNESVINYIGNSDSIVFFTEKSDIDCFIKFLKDYCYDHAGYDIEESVTSDVYKLILPYHSEVRMVKFTGNARPEEKSILTDLIRHSDEKKEDEEWEWHEYDVCTLATKALGMGVDTKYVTQIFIMDIPESWNCYLQEIGRLRQIRHNAFIKVYYSSSDSIKMLGKLINYEKNNPICLYDPIANAMERIKIWDYLCLWEWFIDSSKTKKPMTNVPQNIDQTLEDLKSKTREDINIILQRIIDKDDQINKNIKDSFNSIFTADLNTDNEIVPLVAMNMSAAFITVNNDNYPGIFNGGKARINHSGIYYILKTNAEETNANLNFVDFIVFNAIYTHHLYSSEEVNEKTILNQIIGREYFTEGKGISNSNKLLLNHIKNSIERIKKTTISVYNKKSNNGKNRKLYNSDDGSFPLFDLFPEIQSNMAVINTTKIRYLFEAVQGSRGNSLTASNIIAVYYCLFGIERHKQINKKINNYYKSHKDKSEGELKDSFNGNFRLFHIPAIPPAIDGALTELAEKSPKNKSNPNGEKYEKYWLSENKRQEKNRLIKKMHKIIALDYYPNSKKKSYPAEEKYNELVKIAEKANEKAKEKSNKVKKTKLEQALNNEKDHLFFYIKKNRPTH